MLKYTSQSCKNKINKVIKINKNETFKGKKDLVSVIMPAYNSELFIGKTIESIKNQTYKNWELIIVDDCSTDETVKIINDYIVDDSRIRLIKQEKNLGTAIARNTAVKKARGQYLAFIDSDDLWNETKLAKQLFFMKKNNYKFTSTSYEEVDELGNPTGKKILSGKRLDYDGLLKFNQGNSTIMYNANELGKFYIPDIRKRNDFVMWLQVIKKTKYIYGMEEALTQYRIREGSLSENKLDLIKYQWKVYREIESLSLAKSIYLLLHKIFTVILR